MLEQHYESLKEKLNKMQKVLETPTQENSEVNNIDSNLNYNIGIIKECF